LLNKLNLGKKFLRKLLYTHRTVIRISIIKPKTAIAMATLQLYISYTRIKSNTGGMITALEEIIDVNSGYADETL